MGTNRLDGRTFVRMLAGGTENLSAHSTEIDDLNVFPVPDGDTGSNMTSTMSKGADKLTKLADNPTLEEVADSFASGTVLGARGNSGVILSQIFMGIGAGLAGCRDAGALDLVRAYQQGVSRSYAAVANPTEGTILTVFREATEFAASKVTEKSSIEDFYRHHIEQARDTLSRTKEMLPVLAEADVIDSGGAGYLAIAEGMLRALSDADYVPEKVQPKASGSRDVNLDAFTRDSVLEFGYCTELLIRLQTSKVDVDSFDTDVILDFLESHGGDSIVCFKEGDVVKIHVHTKDPGQVLSECRRYGEFLTVKIENMSLQHEEILVRKGSAGQRRKHLAVIAMAPGEGIAKAFRDLGADVTLGDNPSTGDFVDAINGIAADNYIILPNDKNVVMAAEQASHMVEGVRVHVVPTRSVQEGHAVLSILTPDVPDVDALVQDLKAEADNVTSASVALATRDADISGQHVQKGDFIALFSKDNIVSDRKDKVQALVELLEGIEGMDDMEIGTIFCGKDVTEDERESAEAAVEERWPDLQVEFIEGGQEVYCFLVGLE
ncbi:MAG: DAK2 domain-containing protein [Spirochaetales bacterium]|nr:DAK2 domain-containing protein [Spirochaetales bacterium]